MVGKSVTAVRKALGDAAKEKLQRYRDAAERVSARFVTFAMDVHGVMTGDGKGLLRELATARRATIVGQDGDPSTVTATMVTALSRALAFGNGLCLYRSGFLSKLGLVHGRGGAVGAYRVPGGFRRGLVAAALAVRMSRRETRTPGLGSSIPAMRQVHIRGTGPVIFTFAHQSTPLPQRCVRCGNGMAA